MATIDSDPKVAKALAAPTRAAILELLRSRGPATAKEVAEETGVHANVARSHLEVLTAAGLSRISWRRNVEGGRPAKVYEAAPMHVEEGPTLVAEMLASLVEAAGPAPGAARKIAEAAGERLGRRFRPPGEALLWEQQIEGLLWALSAVSGGVRIVDRGEGWVEFEDDDCPFRPIANGHPELACSLDKALKEGVMRALGADVFVEVVTSIAWGDPTCRERVQVRVAEPEKGAANV